MLNNLTRLSHASLQWKLLWANVIRFLCYVNFSQLRREQSYYGSNPSIDPLHFCFNWKVTFKKKPILMWAVQNGSVTHGVLWTNCTLPACKYIQTYDYSTEWQCLFLVVRSDRHVSIFWWWNHLIWLLLIMVRSGHISGHANKIWRSADKATWIWANVLPVPNRTNAGSLEGTRWCNH